MKKELKHWVTSRPRFDCKDITEVEKEKDRLAREKEETELKLNQEKQKVDQER